MSAIIYFPPSDKENIKASDIAIDHGGYAFPHPGYNDFNTMAALGWLQKFEDTDLDISEPKKLNKKASDYGGFDFIIDSGTSISLDTSEEDNKTDNIVEIIENTSEEDNKTDNNVEIIENSTKSTDDSNDETTVDTVEDFSSDETQTEDNKNDSDVEIIEDTSTKSTLDITLEEMYALSAVDVKAIASEEVTKKNDTEADVSTKAKAQEWLVANVNFKKVESTEE